VGHVKLEDGSKGIREVEWVRVAKSFKEVS
jgi:hypothetical protein